jgi:hypothetical protein
MLGVLICAPVVLYLPIIERVMPIIFTVKYVFVALVTPFALREPILVQIDNEIFTAVNGPDENIFLAISETVQHIAQHLIFVFQHFDFTL